MKAFNNNKYLKEEYNLIKIMASNFDKLYLEIGGHLLSDEHASRVLPGYKKDNKLKIIKKFKKNAGVIYCVNAKEIEKNRTWGNTKKKLETIVLEEIKNLEKELDVIGISINLFTKEKRATDLGIKLSKKFNLPVYFTYFINGYPKLENAFSKNGFKIQPKINTDKKIVVVTGAGANNGKLFFCLSQIYHLEKEEKNAGYAKIESFPIWNLPPQHEINLAYEAATADISDKVLIDKYYKKAYGKNATNYNRDINAFPILKKIITKLTSKNNFMKNYKSPTDMGINALKNSINNEDLVKKASLKEIERRLLSFKKLKNKKAVKKINDILSNI